MSDSIPHPASETTAIVAVRPEARCAVTVRLAVAGDVPFIDELQKMHSHMVGWFPRKQMESYIEGGHILIAEDGDDETERQRDRVGKADGDDPELRLSVSPSLRLSTPLGYCIAKDSYMGRDDVGILYQVNVVPMQQRMLIGATLVQACMERAAYGCRLFSGWCAQDIRASFFWEALGFVPLAFRTGSRGKQRIHIFWQRRVREDDAGDGESGGHGAAPYWFPSQTRAGAVREDRLVLPIPPGTHWRDVKPIVLPELDQQAGDRETPKALPGGAPVRGRPEGPKVTTARKMAVVRSKSRHLGGLPPGKAAVMSAGGIRYVERGDAEAEADEKPKPNRKRARKPKAKHDPKHLAAARELRDRYLEQVNTPGSGLLPGAECVAKYDVSRRAVLTTENTELSGMRLLDPGC